MKMYKRIKSDIKEAMKNKNVELRDCLRMVVDKAKTAMKEKNPTEVIEDIPDDVIINAVQKEMKQLKQTADALYGKEDSNYYQETIYKISILSQYLPKQMTREEVEATVAKILSSGEYSNFGMMMKAVMNELRGKADNKLIKEVVESYK